MDTLVRYLGSYKGLPTASQLPFHCHLRIFWPTNTEQLHEQPLDWQLHCACNTRTSSLRTFTTEKSKNPETNMVHLKMNPSKRRCLLGSIIFHVPGVSFLGSRNSIHLRHIFFMIFLGNIENVTTKVVWNPLTATYPPGRLVLKMMFIFPRWDMLVPCRVDLYIRQKQHWVVPRVVETSWVVRKSNWVLPTILTPGEISLLANW